MTSRSSLRQSRFTSESGKTDGTGRDSDGGFGDHARGGAPLDQPVDRILTSLDRLGERIRALSANRDDTPQPSQPRPEARSTRPDDRRGDLPPRDRFPSDGTPYARRATTPAGVDLQRAIEEIARKRDSLDRSRPDRDRADREPPRARSERDFDRPRFERDRDYARAERDFDRPTADRYARPASYRYEAAGYDHREAPSERRTAAVIDDLRGDLRDIKRSIEHVESTVPGVDEISRRIEALTRSVADGRSVTMLRDEVSHLREIILESTAASPVKALTATYDELLRRLDAMHGAIDNPKTMAEVVQRLGEVRRLLGGLITESQASAILGRIDAIAERLDGTVDKNSLGALQAQIGSLSQAVAGIDQTRTVTAIEASLGAVIDQLSAIDLRLARLDDVERWHDNLERNTSALSQLAQRTEQLPRVAHEMERQSASVETIVRSTENLPRIAAEMEALRRAIDPTTATRGLDSLGARIDGLAERVEGLAAPAEFGERLGQITERLQRLDQKTDLLPRVAETVDRQTDAMRRQADTVERQADTIAEQTEAIRRQSETVERQTETLAHQTEALRRTADTFERQTGTLVQQTEALIRTSETVDRQSEALREQAEAVDGLARKVDVLPKLATEVGEIRRAVEASDPQRGIEQIIVRIDDLNARIEGMAASGELISDGGLELRLAEIARRLDKLEIRPGTPGLIHLEEHLSRLAATIDDKIADGPMGGLPAGAAETLARIERHLSAPQQAQAFVDLEDRIADLTRAVETLDVRSMPDIGDLERTLADLRGEVAILSAQRPLDVERELRALTDRIDRMSGQDLLDPAKFARIEERIADLVDRLDSRPTEATLLADALARFERLLADAFDPDRIADGAVKAAAAALTARGSQDTHESLAQIHSDLANLQDDLRSSAYRDRELLAAISDAVDRLSARAPDGPQVTLGLRPALKDPAPVETAPVPPLPEDDADAATWREIERTLAENIGQRPRRAAEALEAAFADVDGGARLFGRRAGTEDEAKAPVVADKPADDAVAPKAADIKAPTVDVAAAPEAAADDEPLDLNAPLEPGSGKPRLTAKAALAGAKSSDTARSEPSKADFIAAARRAAQAAGAELPAAGRRSGAQAAAPSVALSGDETKAASKGRFALKLPSAIAANKRQILVATLAVGVALVGTRMVVTNFLQDAPTSEVAEAARPVEVTPMEVAPPADEPPAEVATTVETPPAAEPPVADATRMASVPSETVAPTEAGTPAPSTSPTAEPAPASAPSSGVASLPPGPAGELGRPAAAAAPEAPADADADGGATAETPAAETVPPTGTVVAGLPPEMAAPVVATPPAATPMPPLPETVGPLALRQAALAGNPVAQFEVAARLTEGRGVPQNLQVAVKWYELAAKNGLAPAQYRLGSLYEKGQGVVRDTKAAADWYSKAADVGNAKAMHNLAVLYAEGGLGQPDYNNAARWFQKAADLGVRDSQYNLGILYARGLGVPRDLTASYKWFAIAAAAGDSDSAKKRDDVAQVLDKDALARARLAVETWKAQTPDATANDVATDDPAWTAPGQSAASVVSTGDLVLQAQTMLAQRGYDVGKPDGLMGKRTRDAITAFQKEKGLPATGTVDAALIQALAEQAI